MVEQHDSSHSLLVQILKQAPTRQWMEEYLDLVKELLEFTGIQEDDPRVSISLAKGYGVVVNINRRHVLTSFWNSNAWVGFIFNPAFEQLSELLSRAVEFHQFKPHAGETLGKTPYIVRFEGMPKSLLSIERKNAWKKAVLSELDRGKSSPYKRWHTSIAYKAVVDPLYRSSVFQEAFSDPKQMESLGQQQVLGLLNSNFPDLSAASHQIEAEGYFEIENLEDARQRITASIVQRQGQSEFRRKLLNAYNGRCSITGCNVEPALEAAHIIPYQGSKTNHPANGLLLRADIHTLFDLYLLTVEPNSYEIVIAPALAETCYQELAGQKLALPQSQIALPDRNALKKHYETFLQKHGNG